ncbi:unnamed protein product [Symbiodinium sp. CCMP2456]|nr:unnamed protein product [Symbiodinium sp. CCMP2456]
MRPRDAQGLGGGGLGGLGGLGLEVFSEQQLRETCLRLEGRVRMLRSFLEDLHCENATLRRQRAVLSDRLGEVEDSLCVAAASGDAGDGEDRDGVPPLQAPKELVGQNPDGVELTWQLSNCQQRPPQAQGSGELQVLTEKELELRRCQAQEEQLRMEVCEHQLSRVQMEQEFELRLRRCQAQEEEEQQMEAGMVQPLDVRGFFKGTYTNARAHDTPVSSEKILLGPSAHASAAAFTWAAASPGSGQADARSERSERSGPGIAQSVTSFALAHSHILQRKVLPAGEASQSPQGGSSAELQLPPPPRSSPARDVSELRPADLKLTVLTSDSRWETLMFHSGNFEKQALEFLRQKKLKAAFVGGLAAKMKAMVAAGQAQSSVDIVDLI